MKVKQNKAGFPPFQAYARISVPSSLRHKAGAPGTVMSCTRRLHLCQASQPSHFREDPRSSWLVTTSPHRRGVDGSQTPWASSARSGDGHTRAASSTRTSLGAGSHPRPSVSREGPVRPPPGPFPPLTSGSGEDGGEGFLESAAKDPALPPRGRGGEQAPAGSLPAPCNVQAGGQQRAPQGFFLEHIHHKGTQKSRDGHITRSHRPRSGCGTHVGGWLWETPRASTSPCGRCMLWG